MIREADIKMYMDPKAAATLRHLFISRAGQYPYLLPTAEIKFQNAGGSKMTFQAHTPFEASSILMHCLAQDGSGVFNRAQRDGSLSPLSIVMNKRIRLSPDNREHNIEAFRFTYQPLDEAGHLRISDPEISKYFWRGDEIIWDKDPMTFHAPKVNDLIESFWRAGDNWGRVNFMSAPHIKPALRLAHVNNALDRS